MRWIAGTLLVFTFAFIQPTDPYPKDYFQSPLNTALRLSGTFGELRPDHFHTGIDIKSPDGKVGHTVVAAADGYIARVNVQPGGYGNALYVRHPNGYTTVYAHLDAFSDEVAAFVKKAQYTRKSFSVDLYPSPGQFKVEKGKPMAKLGNSGGSGGPHLHFEIRDTRSSRPLNPLLFGMPVTDNVPPRMHQLKVYWLNDKLETQKSEPFNLVKTGAATYKIQGDTIYLDAWRVGFGLKVYDHMNYVTNWNGIYRLEMKKNETPAFSFEMEKLNFSENRYLNAHLDYAEQVTNKAYFNRCYKLPGSRLSIYPQQDGVVELYKDKATRIDLMAEDADGNSCSLRFWVKRSEIENPPPPLVYNYLLPYNEDNVINTGSLRVFIPKGALYENLAMQYSSEKDASSGIYAPFHHIHTPDVPLHQYIDLSITADAIPETLKSKAFIAYCNTKREVRNCGGSWEGNQLKAKVRQLGDYTIMVDEIPPTISPVLYKENMRGMSKMTFRIRDNFEVSGNARGLQYEGTLDGQWLLFEYDAKNDLLIHTFDERTQPGTHQLRLTVRDNRGNATVWEGTFTR